MNSKFLTCAAVSLLMMSSASVFAKATVVVGDNTVVTAINGQEVKTGLFSRAQRSFNLEPGKHVITAKYTRLYNLRTDDHDILRSSNISLPITLADNQTYTLIMANQPDAYAEAKQYIKKPTLALMQGNTVIASEQATSENNSSIFSGLGKALGGVFGGDNNAVKSNQQAIQALDNNNNVTIPAINQSNNATTAVTPAPSVVNTNTVTSNTPNNTINGISSDTLDQFMQLWLKATPAEREKIRQWIKK